MIITKETLLNFEQRYRTHLVNSLNGYKSANLIGTTDGLGQTNLAIFSSVIHLGTNPPLMGFITRPDVVPRHTLENIKEMGCYTINHIHSGIIRQAHQSSARFDRAISEFEATGLSPEFLEGFKAPYLSESNISLGMELSEIMAIKSNGTILVVGEVQWIRLPEKIILPDGKLDLEQANTVVISGLDSYHNTSQITRLSYAKVGKALEHIG